MFDVSVVNRCTAGGSEGVCTSSAGTISTNSAGTISTNCGRWEFSARRHHYHTANAFHGCELFLRLNSVLICAHSNSWLGILTNTSVSKYAGNWYIAAVLETSSRVAVLEHEAWYHIGPRSYRIFDALKDFLKWLDICTTNNLHQTVWYDNMGRTYDSVRGGAWGCGLGEKVRARPCWEFEENFQKFSQGVTT